jgi:hypothetical protein
VLGFGGLLLNAAWRVPAGLGMDFVPEGTEAGGTMRIENALMWHSRSSLHPSNIPNAGPSTHFGAKTRQNSLRKTVHL